MNSLLITFFIAIVGVSCSYLRNLGESGDFVVVESVDLENVDWPSSSSSIDKTTPITEEPEATDKAAKIATEAITEGPEATGGKAKIATEKPKIGSNSGKAQKEGTNTDDPLLATVSAIRNGAQTLMQNAMNMLLLEESEDHSDHNDINFQFHH